MKSRILEELPLIGASFVIAFVLWLIAKQGDLDTNWVTIPVQVVNVPTTMKVESSEDAIGLKVQFPAEQRNDVLAKNFSLQIDATQVFDSNPSRWTDASAALKQERTITPAMITKIGLDPAVEIIEVDPNVVTLVGEFYTQTVTIEVPTTGTLPANKAFTQPPRPDPAQIKVTGTQEALSALAELDYKVKTAAVNLSALQGSTQVFPALKLPPGLQAIDLRNGIVTVNIGLIEKNERRVLPGIPAIVIAFDPRLVWEARPRTVDVTLEGPPSALDQVTPADVTVSPTRRLSETQDGPQDVAIEARLRDSVPIDVARQIVIVECQPSRITVEFKPATVQNIDGVTTGGVQ